MAFPKKPRNLKILTGSRQPLGPDPIDLPLVDAAPAAPQWLPNAHAVNEWHRLTRTLFANRLLTHAGLSALGHLCALHGKIVQLYAAGEAPGASLVGTLRNLMNDFGLSPVALSKVKPGAETEKGNRFAKNGKHLPWSQP